VLSSFAAGSLSRRQIDGDFLALFFFGAGHLFVCKRGNIYADVCV